MNYIWEMLLKADRKGITRDKIKFVQAQICSPYMEVAFKELNATDLPEDNIIEVNECYRFYEIFKDLFNINLEESQELREILLDILLHYLAELDLKKGLSKTEFYKKFLLKDILDGVLGDVLAKNIKYFTYDEQDVLLSGIITLYRTGISLELFNRVLRRIFKNSIVYSSKEKIKNIYIYLDEIESVELKNKVDSIIETFLPINMRPLIFWNQHFGIIGIDKTMKINGTIMVE